MLHLFLMGLISFSLLGTAVGKHHSEGDNVISSLRNNANLDLPVDEEYEDLRAELLAYHTALASLTSSAPRRSMTSTPCWTLGGICINYKLCTGFRYLTEVPGCKDKLNVCCFTWNRFKIRDMRDKGIGTLALPWSPQQDFGGQGIIDVEKVSKKKLKKHKSKKTNNTQAIALIIRSNK